MTRRISAGVLITDGRRLLLGHAVRSPRWDIPKGLVESGEALAEAAIREVFEETGLRVPPGALVPLGMHRYLPGKDLALFAWAVDLPDPAALRCTSTFSLPGGAELPEFDRFGLFTWPEALARVGRNLARVLGALAEVHCPIIAALAAAGQMGNTA